MEEPKPQPGKLRRNLRAVGLMTLACYGPMLLFQIVHLVLYRTGTVPRLNGLMSSYPWWFILCVNLSLVYHSFPKMRRVVPMMLVSALLGVLCMGAALAVNFKAVRVEGQSMTPTLQPGDVLLVDLTDMPEDSGGIYVLDVEEEEHHPLIKRLVGLPGETIDVRYGRVFSDDQEVYPRDGTPSDTWNKNRPAQARFYSGGKALGEGEYFFLGDNPPDSRDSRHFGTVKEDAIEGRAVWSLRGSLGFGPLN
jgi:signal peptidase I